MKTINKTYIAIIKIECSHSSPSEKQSATMKELRKLYNIGRGVGKRVGKRERN